MLQHHPADRGPGKHLRHGARARLGRYLAKYLAQYLAKTTMRIPFERLRLRLQSVALDGPPIVPEPPFGNGTRRVPLGVAVTARARG